MKTTTAIIFFLVINIHFVYCDSDSISKLEEAAIKHMKQKKIKTFSRTPLQNIENIRNMDRRFTIAFIQCSSGQKDALSIIVDTITKKRLEICDVSFKMGFSTTYQTLNNVLYMYTGNSFAETDTFLQWWSANKSKEPDKWVKKSIDISFNDKDLTAKEKAHIFRFTCNADIFYNLPAFKRWWAKNKNNSQEQWFLTVGDQYIGKIYKNQQLKPEYHEGFNKILKYGGKYNIGLKLSSIADLKSFAPFIQEYWEIVKKEYHYNFLNRF